MFFLFPEGRSSYNAMQVSLKENVTNPIKGIKAANFQASYSLSRFSNSGGATVNRIAGGQRSGLCSGRCRLQEHSPVLSDRRCWIVPTRYRSVAMWMFRTDSVLGLFPTSTAHWRVRLLLPTLATPARSSCTDFHRRRNHRGSHPGDQVRLVRSRRQCVGPHGAC